MEKFANLFENNSLNYLKILIYEDDSEILTILKNFLLGKNNEQCLMYLFLIINDKELKFFFSELKKSQKLYFENLINKLKLIFQKTIFCCIFCCS